MVDGIDVAAAPSGPGCQECEAATVHAEVTGHPVIASFEPGETWFYNYPDAQMYAGPELAAPLAHPLDQPTPGPAGRVPPDWQEYLH